MRFTIRLLLLFLCCVAAGEVAMAQPNVQTFGRSRIQYKNFDWKLYSTQNFNIYFYAGGDQSARNAAEYAERELKRITSFIGYYPYSKITLIVYNSMTDLKQSNIGMQRDQFQTGGETLFIKNKLELAYDGTQTDFKRDLSYQLTELLLNDMMYGGSLKEALQSSYLLRLPDWFISGVAAYTAEGWSLRMDNYVRDMLMVNSKARMEDVLARDQELGGQAVWNYIAERYGYTSIQNILNLTRITRDTEVGITSSLNIPYKRFLQDCHNYYMQINTRGENPLVSLPAENKIFQKNRKDNQYTQPVLNPAGTLMAYAENENGSYQIIVKEVGSNRSRVVWKSGYKTVDQRIDYKLPVLAWRTNTQLGFVEARRGQMVLRQINSTRRRSRIPVFDDIRTPAVTLSQFSQVRDMSYSEDGSTLLISAVRDGQTDLYLLSSGGRMQQQLTNDIYDDIQPVFLKGGSNQIAFSSNRFIDTTGQTATGSFAGVVNNYDIFLMSRDGGNARQITFSIASELRPRATDDGNLVYLSEETGVRSLYRFDIAAGTSRPITNFLQDIESYDVGGGVNALVLTARDNARSFVYAFPTFSPTTQDSLPKTSRQIILETRARSAAAATTATTRKIVEGTTTRKRTPRQGEVDIENYQFESDAKEQQEAEAKAKTQAAAPQRARTTDGGVPIAGPVNYDLRFSVQEVITSVYADPQLGFGIVAGVNMSDLFENHHIRGNAFVRTDLETSRMFAEYMNLKNRFDIGLQYRRDVIVGQAPEFPGSVVRFGKHEFSPTLVYPLSYSTSIRMQPRFVNTRFTYINSFVTPDRTDYFGGGSVELVFDNSVVRGVNMLEGTRMKAGIMSLKNFEHSSENFSKFYLDVRHYQKIHRQITLAGRINYGTFFGNAPKNFLIGGMDNWLFASEDDGNPRDAVVVRTPADLFYLDYTTPLRGFNFNARRGSKVLLANLELRVPIVQYLYDGPIPSGFFRNLQFTAFGDAGSAYNGTNPFTGNNSINTRVIGGRIDQTNTSPFEITVINYRNPFLLGYGVGARTTLFGVYGKVDMAWSQEDNSRRGPKFYITLGYDF
ncbi:hypothetical protein I0P70_09390 [Pontibacter sp. FD36]|uniref:hypothetical protein n=1 Tax=Pontibacter sp. FD36 TaxID=2789860 RepID=UPI0018AC1ACA|nr:hypothetical protein [Pontibacter sp. FD36]MBF8963459.1 hypothetical protein [Pontibacter sp. FD36]